MNSLSFNKSKVTRSLILIFFIYNLKIYNKNNISPEIYLALSDKSRAFCAKHKFNINKLLKMKSKQALY